MSDQQKNMFAEEIQAMIEQLSSKSASERRQAAYFLGEAAAADSAPDLIDVYQKDRDASVRAAAAYALGMFKAIDRTLAAGGEGQVTQLLRQIEEEGKLGSRAHTERTVKTIVGLIFSLVAILVVFFGFQPQLKARLFGSTHNRPEVVTDLRQHFNMVNNDTRTLQGELINVISNQPLGCVAFFNNPPPYQLDPVDAQVFPDLAAIGTRLSAIQSHLADAKARYDDACNDSAAFGVTEARDTFTMLTPALQDLVPLEADLAQVEAKTTNQPAASSVQPTTVPVDNNQAAPTNAPATNAPAPTPQGSLQPGVELQPTVPPAQLAGADPKSHLAALYNLVDDVTTTRGASTLLMQYWQDVQNSGSTTGCDIGSFPVIPNSVFVPEIDLQASPSLRDAVQLINNGLAALRDGWQNFQTACARHELSAVAQSGLTNAQIVADSFNAAKVLLDRVQTGG
jgi:HEAT repeats